MLKEKYYYSKGYRKAFMDVVLDEHNNIVRQSNICCIENLPRITICGIYDNERHTMTYGIARCQPEDEFRRKIGQKISYGRAISNPYRVVQIQPTDKISDLFIINARQIEKEILGQQVPNLDE